MNFTFGIITNGNSNFINMIIDSIESEKIPDYEVIVVGGDPICRNNTNYISFNESIKPAWITKKKNIITHASTKDNIVFMHDYYSLAPEWFNGFLKFGDDFDICMTKVVDIKDRRYSDWVNWDSPNFKKYELIDYNIDNSKYNYIPGCYWVAKKNVMISESLNERLSWGESEDIDWSVRVRSKFKYRMNQFSTVKHLKKFRGFVE